MASGNATESTGTRKKQNTPKKPRRKKARDAFEAQAALHQRQFPARRTTVKSHNGVQHTEPKLLRQETLTQMIDFGNGNANPSPAVSPASKKSKKRKRNSDINVVDQVEVDSREVKRTKRIGRKERKRNKLLAELIEKGIPLRKQATTQAGVNSSSNFESDDDNVKDEHIDQKEVILPSEDVLEDSLLEELPVEQNILGNTTKSIVEKDVVVEDAAEVDNIDENISEKDVVEDDSTGENIGQDDNVDESVSTEDAVQEMNAEEELEEDVVQENHAGDSILEENIAQVDIEEGDMTEKSITQADTSQSCDQSDSNIDTNIADHQSINKVQNERSTDEEAGHNKSSEKSQPTAPATPKKVFEIPSSVSPATPMSIVFEDNSDIVPPTSSASSVILIPCLKQSRLKVHDTYEGDSMDFSSYQTEHSTPKPCSPKVVRFAATPDHVVENRKRRESQGIQQKPLRKPRAVKPKVIQPRVVEPEATEPEIIEPVIIEPVVPEAFEPETIEPEAFELEIPDSEADSDEELYTQYDHPDLDTQSLMDDLLSTTELELAGSASSKPSSQFSSSLTILDHSPSPILESSSPTESISKSPPKQNQRKLSPRRSESVSPTKLSPKKLFPTKPLPTTLSPLMSIPQVEPVSSPNHGVEPNQTSMALSDLPSQSQNTQLQSQRLSTQIMRSMYSQKHGSDIFSPLVPSQMDLILNRTKNHVFRHYLFPPDAQRMWIYETAPRSRVKYMATISGPKGAGEIEDESLASNKHFNDHPRDHFAYEIYSLYELADPVSWDYMKDRSWTRIPPQTFNVLPPAIKGQLIANLMCDVFEEQDLDNACRDGAFDVNVSGSQATSIDPRSESQQAEAQLQSTMAQFSIVIPVSSQTASSPNRSRLMWNANRVQSPSQASLELNDTPESAFQNARSFPTSSQDAGDLSRRRVAARSQSTRSPSQMSVDLPITQEDAFQDAVQHLARQPEPHDGAPRPSQATTVDYTQTPSPRKPVSSGTQHIASQQFSRSPTLQRKTTIEDSQFAASQELDYNDEVLCIPESPVLHATKSRGEKAESRESISPVLGNAELQETLFIDTNTPARFLHQDRSMTTYLPSPSPPIGNPSARAPMTMSMLRRADWERQSQQSVQDFYAPIPQSGSQGSSRFSAAKSKAPTPSRQSKNTNDFHSTQRSAPASSSTSALTIDHRTSSEKSAPEMSSPTSSGEPPEATIFPSTQRRPLTPSRVLTETITQPSKSTSKSTVKSTFRSTAKLTKPERKVSVNNDFPSTQRALPASSSRSISTSVYRTAFEMSAPEMSSPMSSDELPRTINFPSTQKQSLTPARVPSKTLAQKSARSSKRTEPERKSSSHSFTSTQQPIFLSSDSLSETDDQPFTQTQSIAPVRSSNKSSAHNVASASSMPKPERRSSSVAKAASTPRQTSTSSAPVSKSQSRHRTSQDEATPRAKTSLSKSDPPSTQRQVSRNAKSSSQAHPAVESAVTIESSSSRNIMSDNVFPSTQRPSSQSTTSQSRAREHKLSTQAGTLSRVNTLSSIQQSPVAQAASAPTASKTQFRPTTKLHRPKPVMELPSTQALAAKLDPHKRSPKKPLVTYRASQSSQNSMTTTDVPLYFPPSTQGTTLSAPQDIRLAPGDLLFLDPDGIRISDYNPDAEFVELSQILMSSQFPSKSQMLPQSLLNDDVCAPPAWNEEDWDV